MTLAVINLNYNMTRVTLICTTLPVAFGPCTVLLYIKLVKICAQSEEVEPRCSQYRLGEGYSLLR